MSNFEKLKKEIDDLLKNDPENLGEFFQNLDCTPDNPKKMQEIIKDAGIDEEVTPETAAEMVKEMSENLSPEIKKCIGDLMINLSDSLSAGPMPKDLEELIKKWQKGE